MAKQSQRGADLMAIPVFLTRPKEQAIRFGTEMERRFGRQVRPLLTPLMRPVYQAPAIPQRPYSAVVFTSEAAVEAVVRMPSVASTLPRAALCVGARTAKAAEAAGFSAQSAEGGVGELLALILLERTHGPLLYLHGRDTRGNLKELLDAAGIETESVTVYKQDPQALSAEAKAMLAQAGPVIVPLFSPRSADLFADALPGDVKARISIAAMSKAVAEIASRMQPAEIRIAKRPDAEAMLDAVDQLLIGLRGS